jgi:hypothetical protein
LLSSSRSLPYSCENRKPNNDISHAKLFKDLPLFQWTCPFSQTVASAYLFSFIYCHISHCSIDLHQILSSCSFPTLFP